ncbi:NAD(P)/FAD-dependent oxidoreductase [Aquisalimonas asiatica]|uniref:Flavoprotein, HI0933 family n=1 Tax=Aquisalimonas asiatica TaxID=406100 RepID=A0A1H8Q5B8_9GAMM|nr:NAD(P)/FAD-dependent oxidoreductase [Aquisalimonas asiatica]SEO49266.1 hypothetical protein SAMN04488052_101355 [Aquisalimonas asiatica]
MKPWDVVIIGGGAAGLFCAALAGQRGRRVLVIEHTSKVGRKILMSGGGRCNFTNMYSEPENFLSANPHFAKSALSRYTPWDFIALVESHGIPWHEKKLGQLFCDNKARDIVDMLLRECQRGDVQILTRTSVESVTGDGPFHLATSAGAFSAESLVIATGGLSIPRMGATDFGQQLARDRGLNIVPMRAGLVPFLFGPRQQRRYGDLAGVSLDAVAETGSVAFRENILFTHKGLSGPATLQVSSYWREGQAVSIDLDPDGQLEAALQTARHERPKVRVRTLLAHYLTRRVAARWCEQGLPDGPMGTLSDHDVDRVIAACRAWRVHPEGTEGYATAEVTLGGVDTRELSSKTMASRAVPDLYFIGEVVDVTGHLGGHNFQWAWASAHAAAQSV